MGRTNGTREENSLLNRVLREAFPSAGLHSKYI